MAFTKADLSILYIGTPVVLITTIDRGGNANIGPMSSAWALGDRFVLGLGAEGKTFQNLVATGECVLNFPSANQWEKVERLAPTTGADPVPECKRERFRFEPDKFGCAGLSPIASEIVRPSRILECPIQMEAKLVSHHALGIDGAVAIEVEVLRTWVQTELLSDDRHIIPERWKPLIYNFRHYFGLGAELGKSFRSET